MDKQSAKQILQSRSVISKVGKYTVKVTSVTNGHVRESDGRVIDIVNFNCMTGYQASQALASFKAGEYEEATARTAMSTSVLDRQYCPLKGEIVDIEVGEIYSEKAESNILVVTSIVPRQAEAPKKFSLDFEDDADEQEEAPAESKAKQGALV